MTRLPQIGFLADGKRCICRRSDRFDCGDVGSEANVRAAYDAAARGFTGLLDELCEELAELRKPADPARCALQGNVARRMHAAVAPYAAEHFIHTDGGGRGRGR